MPRWTVRLLGSAAAFAVLTAGTCGDPAEPTAKPAAKLAVATAPTAAPLNRAVFATQPIIQVQDADGGSVTAAGTVVTVAMTSGTGALSGTTTASTDATGKATFTNLMITGTVGARVLTFTATGLTAITANVTLAAGAATAMTVSAGQSQSATVGTAVTIKPAVLVADADANPVSGVMVAFAVTAGGGSVTGGSQVTGATGVATVGSWTLGATAGTNTLSATATGPTAVTFTATGTAALGTTTNVSFCGATPLPVWFGYQNGTGAWTQLAAKTDNTYDVPITTVGGIAWVSPGRTGGTTTSNYNLGILYMTKAELGSLGCALGDGNATGTRTINGTLANVSASQMSQIAFGSEQAFAGQGVNTFQITNAPAGARDLIGWRAPATGFDLIPDRFIVRRDQNPASGGSFAVLDFAAAEALAPASAGYTISNIGTDQWDLFMDMTTANLTTTFISSISGTGTGATVSTSYQVPAASQRLATDNYRLFVGAFGASGDRGVQIQNMATFNARTATLGPALSTPTVTQATTTPNIRMRLQLASQAQYGAGVVANYWQSSTAAEREAFIYMSSGYLGATPATWDVTMPDLSGAGFQTTWGLQTGTLVEWGIEAYSGLPVGTGEITTSFASRQSAPPPAPSERRTPVRGLKNVLITRK